LFVACFHVLLICAIKFCLVSFIRFVPRKAQN